MGRLFHVEDLVDGERSRLAETLPALAALERLLLRVDVAMVAEVVLSPERLSAEVARVRPLVRVGPLVDEKVVRFGELPVAVLADETLLRP